MGSGGVAGTSGGSGGSGGSATAGSSPFDAGGEAAGGMAGASEGGAGQGGAAEGGAGGADGSAPFDGRCGEGWAATGSAPELDANVTPQVDKSGNWTFAFGRYRLVVAGSRGARVTELSIDGVNLLDSSGGSTFWPSPQQAYTWPPPAELDSSAYVAQADGATLSLKSQVAKSLGLSVQKRFWVNEASAVVSIEYQLTNESKQSADWAPWEVSRVRAGGFTFAPQGPGNRTITQDSFQHPLTLVTKSGIRWLDYPSLTSTLTQDNYIAEFDGAEGWLAHANRLGKNQLPLLFVKSFVDAPDASLPSNQAEIQLWTSGTASPKLIEVEEQGAERTLAPGASLTWTVHWSACELASDVELSAGSAELARLARAHAVEP